MKQIFFALLMVTSLNVCAGEAEDIEAGKAAIASGLKDPSSAQFRNVVVVEKSGKRIVCGEVNAKNAYGGYVGFRPFFAIPEAKLARVKENDPIMDQMVDTACKPAT